MAASKLPSLKVALPTLLAALATIAAAASKGKTNPTTLAAAALTVGQFVIGYLAPHKPIPIPRRRKRLPRQTVTMWDTISVKEIPSAASSSSEAVAGYVDGSWPDYASMVAAFPWAHHLSIAAHAGDDADCLDVESGDATPSQAPAWVRRQLARGLALPVLYCSIAAAPNLIAALVTQGLRRNQIRLWSAHYGLGQHICSPHTCGYNNVTADATQWTDHALGRNLDESLCSAGFFG